MESDRTFHLAMMGSHHIIGDMNSGLLKRTDRFTPRTSLWFLKMLFEILKCDIKLHLVRETRTFNSGNGRFLQPNRHCPESICCAS